MTSFPKKLSCKYTYVKVYICVCMVMHVRDGLSWLKTNILVTKFDPPKQKNPSSAPTLWIMPPCLKPLFLMIVFIT